jgi:hypothetical protein
VQKKGRRMTKMKCLLQISAVAVGAFLATSAQANLINLGDDSIAVNGTILSGTLTGTVTYNNGANSENCYAGIFSLAVSNPNGTPSTAGRILTFCTDVGVNWRNTDTYTALQFAGATGVNSPGNPQWANVPASIQNASWLYNTYFVPNSSTYVNDPNWAAGMQLAIWKVLYDTAANGTVSTLTGTSGNLRATGFGGGIADANTLIGYVNAARGNGTFTQYLDTWLAPNDNASQGLIWNALTPVPEPTTIIAGALLLLPFGASTFRFVRKNRAA